MNLDNFVTGQSNNEYRIFPYLLMHEVTPCSLSYKSVGVATRGELHLL